MQCHLLKSLCIPTKVTYSEAILTTLMEYWNSNEVHDLKNNQIAKYNWIIIMAIRDRVKCCMKARNCDEFNSHKEMAHLKGDKFPGCAKMTNLVNETRSPVELDVLLGVHRKQTGFKT